MPSYPAGAEGLQITSHCWKPCAQLCAGYCNGNIKQPKVHRSITATRADRAIPGGARLRKELILLSCFFKNSHLLSPWKATDNNSYSSSILFSCFLWKGLSANQLVQALVSDSFGVFLRAFIIRILPYSPCLTERRKTAFWSIRENST